MFSFRRFIIKRITPIIWSKSTKRKINAIKDFSVIEKDSGCQLLQCVLLINDPFLKAELFQHVVEEFFHADLFEDLAISYSDKFLITEIRPREYLVTANSHFEEVIEAYAYAHVGEYDVNKDFEIYGHANFDKKIRNTFLRVAADEGRHVFSTDDLLFLMLNKNKLKYRWIILKSFFKIRFNKFSSMMIAIGDFNLTIILSIFYFLFGLLVFIDSKKRFLLSSSLQLEILKEQIDELKGIKRA